MVLVKGRLYVTKNRKAKWFQKTMTKKYQKNGRLHVILLNGWLWFFLTKENVIPVKGRIIYNIKRKVLKNQKKKLYVLQEMDGNMTNEKLFFFLWELCFLYSVLY